MKDSEERLPGPGFIEESVEGWVCGLTPTSKPNVNSFPFLEFTMLSGKLRI